MEPNTETIERVFSTKEVAIQIGIAITTVRKYSQYMERAGYTYLKSETGARMYTEQDITCMRYLTDLRNKSGIKLEEATRIVIDKFGKGTTHNVSPPDTQHIDQYMINLQDLKQDIVKELKVSITDSLNSQNQQLINDLRQILRETQELNRTDSERPNNNKGYKGYKGFFNRLFKL